MLTEKVRVDKGKHFRGRAEGHGHVRQVCLAVQGFLGLSEEVPVGYQEIRVSFKIDADISEAQKQELVEMTQKYSPVFNTITRPTQVKVSLATE